MLSLFSYLSFVLEAFSFFLLGASMDGWRTFPNRPPDAAAHRMLAHGQMPSAGKGSNPSTSVATAKGKRTQLRLQPLDYEGISLWSSGSGRGLHSVQLLTVPADIWILTQP